MNTMQAVSRINATSEAGEQEYPPLWWASPDLKSERVQDRLAARLTRRQVEGVLPLLPGWRLAANGKALERSREFATKDAAALFGAFVAGFAWSLGVPAMVTLSGPQVGVTLCTRRSQGRLGALSEGILGLAKLIG